MNTTEVASREPTLPAVPEEDMLGVSGDLDASDIITPVCSIVQPTSGSDRGAPGRYWWPDGHAVESMDVVVLLFAGTRTLWAPRSDGESAPICRSPDRRMGMTTKPTLVVRAAQVKKDKLSDGEMSYVPCEWCPHANDDPFKSGEGLCKPGYSLLLYNEERGPFLFFVKGAAMRIIKSTIVSPALLRLQRKLPAVPWETEYHWGIRQVENDKGKFYVPDISVLGPVDEPTPYREMAYERQEAISRQMEVAVQEEDGQTSFEEPD